MEEKNHLLSVNGNLVQTCTILETNVGKFPCHKLACALGKYRETVELNRKNITGKVELDLKAAHYILNKEEQNLMIPSWISNVIIPFLYNSFRLQRIPGPQSFSFLPPGCPPLRSTACGLFLTSNQDVSSKSQQERFCPAPSAKNRRQLGAKRWEENKYIFSPHWAFRLRKMHNPPSVEKSKPQ